MNKKQFKAYLAKQTKRNLVHVVDNYVRSSGLDLSEDGYDSASDLSKITLIDVIAAWESEDYGDDYQVWIDEMAAIYGLKGNTNPPKGGRRVVFRDGRTVTFKRKKAKSSPKGSFMKGRVAAPPGSKHGETVTIKGKKYLVMRFTRNGKRLSYAQRLRK